MLGALLTANNIERKLITLSVKYANGSHIVGIVAAGTGLIHFYDPNLNQSQIYRSFNKFGDFLQEWCEVTEVKRVIEVSQVERAF